MTKMTDIVKIKQKTFGDLKVGDVFSIFDEPKIAVVKTDNRDEHGLMNAVRLARPTNTKWQYEIGNDTVVFLPTEINVVF